ncbi:protein kinase domain-containing protein [Gloeomargarita sp.]
MINQLLDGRYRIIDTLAAGGFGKTFLAQDTKRPGQPQCVVKMLHVNANPQAMAVARRLFYKEAEILEKLRHPQIPQLLAFFEQNREFYLVEEFIPGHTLAQELGSGRVFDEGWVLRFLTEVLHILQFIHNRGVIHRDLKPSNLIRRQGDGALVLIDFGAVKQLALEGEAPKEASQTVGIGTQGYMPSEQLRGKPRFSSDLYALGMMAIQALTGVHPRDLPEDTDTGEILWQDRAQVSPALAQILSKMVRYHFSQRYQRAEEVFQDLQPLLAQLPQLGGTVPVAVNLGMRMAEPTHRELPSPTLPGTPSLPVEAPTEATIGPTQTVALPRSAVDSLPLRPTNPLAWVAGGVAALVVLGIGGWWGWRYVAPQPPPAALLAARDLVTQASQATAQAKTLEQLQAAQAQWRQVLTKLDGIRNPGAAASEIAQLRRQSQQEIAQLETRIQACSTVLWGECP